MVKSPTPGHRQMQNLISSRTFGCGRKLTSYYMGVAKSKKIINNALPVSEIFGRVMPVNAQPCSCLCPWGFKSTYCPLVLPGRGIVGVCIDRCIKSESHWLKVTYKSITLYVLCITKALLVTIQCTLNFLDGKIVMNDMPVEIWEEKICNTILFTLHLGILFFVQYPWFMNFVKILLGSPCATILFYPSLPLRTWG